MYRDLTPIKGYEGLYSVSKDGEVISHENKKNHRSWIELKSKSDKQGYQIVVLQDDKERQDHKVHRLVATAFIPNPENKPLVNHINGITSDNRVENLEWATTYENYKCSDKTVKEIPVQATNKLTGEILTFKSIMEASRSLAIRQGNISNALAGRCKSVGGYYWVKQEQTNE